MILYIIYYRLTVLLLWDALPLPHGWWRRSMVYPFPSSDKGGWHQPLYFMLNFE